MAPTRPITEAPDLEALRARIDATLEGFLAEQAAALAAAHPAALEPLDEIRRVLRAGGKRLRPLFCYFGHRAAGGSDGEAILRAAASLELLHTFAVIHDDLMDRSPLRRGQPTTHLALARGDAHAGVAAAVLVGDLALALADLLFTAAGFDAAVTQAGFRWYARMRVEVVAGQYLDLVAARTGEIDEPTARRIAALKSGAYTVEKPLLIGAALAGEPPALMAVLSAYGAALGEAFQLRDDVLGVFGDPAITGKDAHGDLREGKRTLLVARALAVASPAERAFLESALGQPDLADAEAERIREVFRRTGALAGVIEAIEDLRGRAVAALDGAPLDDTVRAALVALADLAALRES